MLPRWCCCTGAGGKRATSGFSLFYCVHRWGWKLALAVLLAHGLKFWIFALWPVYFYYFYIFFSSRL